MKGPIALTKESINIFFKKNNLIYFLKIYVLLVPFSIYFAFHGPKNLRAGLAFAIVGLAYTIIQFFIGLAGIEAVRRVIAKESYSVPETFSYAWKNLWQFSLLSILVFLTIFGGILLLVIPGIIFGIWFSFSRFVFVDQKMGIIASMKKSHDLVRGKFWAVFGRSLVFGLFIALASALVSAVPFVGSAVVTIFGALFVLPFYLLYRELV